MKRSKLMGLIAILAAILCATGSLRAAGPGDMLWEQQFNFTGCDAIIIGAVAASTNSLIVCGTAYNSAIDTGDIGFIKAFDQAYPGSQKWEKTLTAATGGGQNRNSFNSLTVVGNTVVVEGYSSSYTVDPNPPNNITYSLNQTTLRAYNADTGALLWVPVNKSAAAINVGPINVVSANNRVFVVRQQNYHKYTLTGTPSDTGNCIIQAYQANPTNTPALPLLLE